MLVIGNSNLTRQHVFVFVKSVSLALRDLKRTHLIRFLHLH